ncbi:hypothetical protein ACFL3V_04625 [Nanoarchaeota archaeon]
MKKSYKDLEGRTQEKTGTIRKISKHLKKTVNALVLATMICGVGYCGQQIVSCSADVRAKKQIYSCVTGSDSMNFRQYSVFHKNASGSAPSCGLEPSHDTPVKIKVGGDEYGCMMEGDTLIVRMPREMAKEYAQKNYDDCNCVWFDRSAIPLDDNILLSPANPAHPASPLNPINL